ncbi:MAG: alpha/beta hydrolase, partial [Variovorax sp.]|nr:alpha/beta hydrolase [Variovorax sp.]
MPLDTAVRGLLDAVKATGMPTIGSVSAQEMRAFQKAMLAKMPPGPDIFRTEDLVIPSDAGGMAARLYWPSAAPRALIVYFHGGGWTIGSLDGWDGALRRLANTSGCAVLSVDYRLAPEAPFPAAVDDALTAVKWAGTNIAKLAGGNVPLIVAGDSAGGNLSAVTAQTIRDHGGPRIAAQILVYPSTDGDIDSERLSRFESPFLTREETSWFFDQYIPDRAQRTDVRFAPLRAKNLAKLPPAFVLSAENDIL